MDLQPKIKTGLIISTINIDTLYRLGVITRKLFTKAPPMREPFIAFWQRDCHKFGILYTELMTIPIALNPSRYNINSANSGIQMIVVE